MARYGWILAVAASMLLADCGAKPAPPPIAETVVPVTLGVVAPAAGNGAIAVTGTVRLKRETALAFNTSGRVAAITVREGEMVRPGQMLARLDPTGLDAASRSAAADQVRARADYVRLAKLGAQGWVTKSRVESAQAAAAAASAKVDQTGFDVRFGRIVAPVGGIVLRRAFEPGQMVATGTPVVTIGETASGYVLRVALSDADLRRVRLGAGASVTLPALSSEPVAATVGEIAGRGDDRTGTFQVELRLAPHPGLRSGLIGDAVIHGSGGDGASGVSVPASAIFAARADEGFVYVYDHGVVHARLVGVGALTDGGIAVSRGLVAGERIVVSGADRLRDGARVTDPAR
jgi:RND family efflux transporter MFP subunit